MTTTVPRANWGTHGSPELCAYMRKISHSSRHSDRLNVSVVGTCISQEGTDCDSAMPAMAACLVWHVRAGKPNPAALPELRSGQMKVMKAIMALVIMLFLIQQAQKIMKDPGYVGRVVDMITDDTSAEIEGE